MSNIKDAQFDLLWKKIAYSRSRTGQNTNAFEEIYVSSDPVNPNNIWTDATEIPQDPSVPVVLPEVLQTRTRVELTPTSNYKTAYKTNNIDKWISPDYGLPYTIQIEKEDGTLLNQGADGYYFDYSSGVLNFLTTQRTEDKLYATGYTYAGETGSLGGTGNISYVEGASSIPGALAFFTFQEGTAFLSASEDLKYDFYNNSPSKGSIILGGDLKAKTRVDSGVTIYPKVYVGDSSRFPDSSIVFDDTTKSVRLQSGVFSGSFDSPELNTTQADVSQQYSDFYDLSYIDGGETYYAQWSNVNLNYTIVLPYGTDLGSTVFSFVTSSNVSSVTLNGVPQVSSVTENDLSEDSSITYVVTDNSSNETSIVVNFTRQIRNSTPQGDYEYDGTTLNFSDNKLQLRTFLEKGVGSTQTSLQSAEVFSVVNNNDQPFLNLGKQQASARPSQLHFSMEPNVSSSFIAAVVESASFEPYYPFIVEKGRVTISHPKDYFHSIDQQTLNKWDDISDSEQYILTAGHHEINTTSSIGIIGSSKASIVMANSVASLLDPTPEERTKSEISVYKTGSYQDMYLKSSDRIVLVPGEKSDPTSEREEKGNVVVSGSVVIRDNLSILGVMSVEELKITNKTVTHLDASGSTRLGDTPDDTHSLVGTTFITGSMVFSGSADDSGAGIEKIVKSYSLNGNNSNEKEYTEEFYYLKNKSIYTEMENVLGNSLLLELDPDPLGPEKIVEYEFIFMPANLNDGAGISIIHNCIVAANSNNVFMVENKRIEDSAAEQKAGHIEILLEDDGSSKKVVCYHRDSESSDSTITYYNYDIFIKKRKYNLG